MYFHNDCIEDILADGTCVDALPLAHSTVVRSDKNG